ncbi:alanine:cation symporter family protein, partial [Leeuwenhoekiella blandensis]
MKHKLSLLVFLFISFIGAAQEAAEIGIDDQIDQAFAPVSSFFSSVVFFTVFDIPFVLILLVFSALFFTVYFGFPNFRYFWRAIQTVRGKYEDIENHGAKVLYGEDGIANGVDLNDVDIEEHIETLDDDLAIDGDIVDTIRDESSAGEVSHFQALATAVSGTVGNGNIAGVALAIALGGPGATFWMIVCGLLGMSSKFVECTLGVQYRDVGEDGTVYGGPMFYLTKG